MLLAALLVTGAAICAAGQGVAASKQNSRATGPEGKTNKRDPAGANEAAGGVRYSYEFTQPEFVVSHIVIEHDGNGRGQLTFVRKGSEDPIIEPIELSPAVLTRTKARWEALKFLDSKTSYQSERQYPHLGTMRLGMKQGDRERVAEFNWTDDKEVFALANEYRKAADQAIFVFDMSVARENQPLDAPHLMDYLDILYARSDLSDPEQLIPLLRDLSTDERIPLIARNHAARLLKKFAK
jgi:hypothetical protein